MADENRIHSLDSIRGISSFIVVVFHCLISFPVFYAAFYYKPYDNTIVKYLTETPLHIFWAGPEAVLLFFVLSGFVLSLPYLRKNELPYGSYLIKRFFRIYIPYIAIMLIYSAVITALADYRQIPSLSETFNARWVHPVTLKAVISYIFMIGYDMTNVNGVVWSLVHEMRISIIFPLIMVLVNRLDWKWALVSGTGLSLLGSVLVKYFARFSQDEMLTTFINSLGESFYYCMFFVFGAVLAKHRSQIGSKLESLNSVFKLLLTLLAITLICFKWDMHGAYLYTAKLTSFLRGDLIGNLVAALGVVLLFAVALSSKRADRVLSREPFAWLGRISYSVYLTHVIVIMLSARYLSQVIPLKYALLLVPFLNLPVAHLSYKFIELPAMNYGRRLAKRFGERAAALSGGYSQK